MDIDSIKVERVEGKGSSRDPEALLEGIQSNYENNDRDEMVFIDRDDDSDESSADFTDTDTTKHGNTDDKDKGGVKTAPQAPETDPSTSTTNAVGDIRQHEEEKVEITEQEYDQPSMESSMVTTNNPPKAPNESSDRGIENGHDEERGITTENSKEEGVAVINAKGEATDSKKKIKISESKERESPLVYIGSPSTRDKNSKRQQQQNGDGSGHERRCGSVAIGFCCCFALIASLQGAIIGLLVNKNNNSNDEADTNIQNMPPTDVPTTSPVRNPANEGKSFRSIASIPQTVQLRSVSVCSDGCRETVSLPLDDRALWWSNEARIASVVVDTNGYIILKCDNSPLDCGKIDVINRDLTPSTSGNIYMLQKSVDDDQITTVAQHQDVTNSKWSVTISWEGVTVADYLRDDPYKVSTQVTMIQDEITICFGEGALGPGRSFRTGIQNYTARGLGYQPATINPYFDELGFASSFPRNTCETFPYQAGDPINPPIGTLRPTQAPTQAPTCPDWNGGPTLPPSTSPTFPWWYYTRLPNSQPTLRPTFPPTAEPSCLQAPNSITQQLRVKRSILRHLPP
ncbi:MAG: hypothetical protein SGBAC_012532 [Bacillariaceae sp.]